MQTVTVTELEFNKLLRYSEAQLSVEAQAELVVARLRQQIADARKVREDYFKSLVEKYPDLVNGVGYTPIEATFELVPNVVEE